MGRNARQPRVHKQLFDDEGNEALVRNFINIRKNAGLSQAQLAIEMGVKQQHLSRIETRQIQITPTVIFLASRVLEIKPGIFWDDIELTAARDPRKKIDE